MAGTRKQITPDGPIPANGHPKQTSNGHKSLATAGGLSADTVVRFILAHGGRTADAPTPERIRHSQSRSLPVGTPRFIDLFCGIGGFRLAFERAGAKCVFSSDWDKFSRQTYAANFGEEPAGDINAIPVADIPPFDILCGGFPCQPFSLAGVSKKNSLGKKHAFDDERKGNLFFSMAAIVEYHRPLVY